jgi:hypothetical protein
MCSGFFPKAVNGSIPDDYVPTADEKQCMCGNEASAALSACSETCYQAEWISENMNLVCDRAPAPLPTSFAWKPVVGLAIFAVALI